MIVLINLAWVFTQNNLYLSSPYFNLFIVYSSRKPPVFLLRAGPYGPVLPASLWVSE